MVSTVAPEKVHGLISKNLLSELHESFAKNARRTALIWGENSNTYSDLLAMANDIKSALIRRGCRPGMRVALLVGHSPWLVASILAVIKAGATYVPLDIRSPVNRSKFIVADSGVELVVFDEAHQEYADQLNLRGLCVKGVPHTDDCQPDHVARDGDFVYILYTSGSTGRPKGVSISHANLFRYATWASQAYFAKSDDRIALYSTLTFDFTVTSIFPALLKGASISIFDGISNPFVIQEIVADESTNILKITPSYLHVLSELPSTLLHLRRLIVGGEDLSVSLAKKVHSQLSKDAEIINEYGPTEATVGCITHRFDPRQDVSGSVPIGKAIAGVEAIVVNEDGGELSGECTGELVVAGGNVAEGYIALPARTSEVFSKGTHREGLRSYLTGDLVRRRNDGTLMFLGRRDDQAKIRGNRVELGEVTEAILGIASVRSTFVFPVPEHNTKTLAAIVVGKDQGLSEADVRNALARHLPAYMVPSIIKITNEIPLSSNQKVDREKALSLIGKRNSPHDISATS